MSDDLIAQAITGYWGGRCADTDPDCPCCQAWLAYDRQAAERDRLRDALEEIADMFITNIRDDPQDVKIIARTALGKS